MTEEDNNYVQEQYKALYYSYEQFDKSVLFIASGALGISFAFIEKIIPDLVNAVSSRLLIMSWYLFAGVIFVSLVAHFISTRAISWGIGHTESEPDYERKSRRWNHAIRALNVLMIIGLLVGIITLINFVKLNI